MPRFPRLVVPGYPHHVTQRGVRRQRTFFDRRDYLAYLRLVKKGLGEAGIQIWAYCLMPNHIHAVVVPDAEECLSGFFAPLHRRYARRTNQRYEWRGHLWQERFYSVVMEEAHALAAMRYVELNPVRARLCESPVDWPWSSAKGNLGLEFDPIIDRSKTKNIISNWREYLGETEAAEELNDLRRQTLSGRPDVNVQFIRNLEALTGRRIRKKRPGPKAELG